MHQAPHSLVFLASSVTAQWQTDICSETHCLFCNQCAMFSNQCSMFCNQCSTFCTSVHAVLLVLEGKLGQLGSSSASARVTNKYSHTQPPPKTADTKITKTLKKQSGVLVCECQGTHIAIFPIKRINFKSENTNNQNHCTLNIEQSVWVLSHSFQNLL